jgi:hypothetical protein
MCVVPLTKLRNHDPLSQVSSSAASPAKKKAKVEVRDNFFQFVDLSKMVKIHE